MTTEERRARNEAIFRDANEEIGAVRRELPTLDGRTPFFCECHDAACREIVHLRLHEYEAVRENAAAFLIARDHPHDAERVIAEHDAYVVVEKTGTARAIALETDPRSETG